MKNRILFGIFFLITLISTAVFGNISENSRQGFPANFIESLPASKPSISAFTPGFQACDTITNGKYRCWGNLRFPDKKDHHVPPYKKDEIDGILDRFDFGRSMGFDHDSENFGRHFGRTLLPYLYAGRRFDNFSQLYFNRNRMLNPRVGRFISRDPIGFNGGMNLWQYADGNPLRKADKDGLWAEIVATNESDADFLDMSKRVFNFYTYGDGVPFRLDYNSFPDIVSLFTRIKQLQDWYGGIERLFFIGHGNEDEMALKWHYQWRIGYPMWEAVPDNVITLSELQGLSSNVFFRNPSTCGLNISPRFTFFMFCDSGVPGGFAETWRNMTNSFSYGLKGFPTSWESGSFGYWNINRYNNVLYFMTQDKTYVEKFMPRP